MNFNDRNNNFTGFNVNNTMNGNQNGLGINSLNNLIGISNNPGNNEFDNMAYIPYLNYDKNKGVNRG